MKRLFKMLDIAHHHITKRDYDLPLINAGDEGKGKSHLNLHILEYWYTKLGISITSDIINNINLDIVKWAENLKNCKKFQCNIWDEGGELSNKRSISKLNFIISRAFQIIRGDNLFTILTIPSVFDLDGFFTKRRAKGLIHVYARGKFAYWSQERLRQIIAINQNRMVKTPWVVKPTFYDTFPKYKGILLEPYNKKKKDYMKDTRSNLYEEIAKLKGEYVDPETKEMIEMKQMGKKQKEIAEHFGVNESTVSRRLKQVKLQFA